ncbi:MAG: TolC family protein [Thermoguttaceae bacterium]|nr:TolC family protein [Thermoguttaceae bacterium]
MHRLVFLFCATFFSVVASAFSQDAASLPNETPAVSESLDYQSPDVSKQVGASYSATKEVTQISLKTGADVSRWWSQIVVDDPVLARLTREAVSHNLTLHEALINVQAARAKSEQTKQELAFAQSSAQVGRASTFAPEVLELQVEIATTELNRRRELYRDAYVNLVADVAEAYIVARSRQEQIRGAQILLLFQERDVAATRSYADAGTSTPAAVYRALVPTRETQTSLAGLKTQYKQTLNRLCALLGRPAGDDYVDSLMLDDRALPTKEDLDAFTNGDQDKFGGVIAVWLTASRVPKAPQELCVGVPADLLRRRPDLRASEQRVAAQKARVALATLEARRNAQKTKSGAAPVTLQTVGDQFKVEAAGFEKEAADAQYRALVLEAQREVEDALALYVGEQEKLNLLGDAVESTTQALQFASRAREVGARSISDAVSAEKKRLETLAFQIVESETQRALAVVALYRALGGDWDAPSTESVEEAAPENGSEAASEAK